jgi:hypothetical protein
VESATPSVRRDAEQSDPSSVASLLAKSGPTSWARRRRPVLRSSKAAHGSQCGHTAEGGGDSAEILRRVDRDGPSSAVIRSVDRAPFFQHAKRAGEGGLGSATEGGSRSPFPTAWLRQRRQERLGAEGEYYASPIAANGHIYLASSRGTITTIRAGAALEVEARNELGESVMATPAIADNRLYVRSASSLWAFGRK